MSSYSYNVHGVVVVVASKNNEIISLQLYGGDLPLCGVVCDTRQSKREHMTNFSIQNVHVAPKPMTHDYGYGFSAGGNSCTCTCTHG